MKRSLFAVIVGVFVVASAGCSAPGLHARMSRIQFDQNTYVAQVGDTIESIAYRYQISRGRLASLNPNLNRHVLPGDHVRIRSRQEVRGADRKVVTRRRQEAEKEYRYKSTDDNLPPDLLYDPKEYQPSEVIVTAVPRRGDPIRTEQVIERSNAGDLVIEPTLVPQTAIATASSPSRKVAEKNGWRWPSGGEIVREYAPGQANGQGIDIAGVPGQKIAAAANGTVIYAGRDLSDSGNLVIIRHTDNVLSTYSHADDLFVAEDDIVSGGDTIASLGRNSNKESVLHFGIRNNGRPANPLSYLPDR